MYHLPKRSGRFIEDGRNPSLKNFYYFARGVKFDNQDYTAKCVFVENDIEKYVFIHTIIGYENVLRE